MCSLSIFFAHLNISGIIQHSEAAVTADIIAALTLKARFTPEVHTNALPRCVNPHNSMNEINSARAARISHLSLRIHREKYASSTGIKKYANAITKSQHLSIHIAQRYSHSYGRHVSIFMSFCIRNDIKTSHSSYDYVLSTKLVSKDNKVNNFTMPCTRSKTGALADMSGVYGKSNGLIEVRQSKICPGRGLFARRFINEGSLITKYAADIVPYDEAPKENLYILEMDEQRSGAKRNVYVGIHELDKLRHKGLAQLANDAISPTLTGLKNNSRFFRNERGTYLKASRDILPGEEIYVAYGLGYWLSHTGDEFSEHHRQWIELASRLYQVLQEFDKRMRVYEIDDIDDKDIVTLKLEKSFRHCPYTYRDHFDDRVLLRFHKHSNDTKCDIFYKCQTCWRDNHLLTTYDLL